VGGESDRLVGCPWATRGRRGPASGAVEMGTNRGEVYVVRGAVGLVRCAGTAMGVVRDRLECEGSEPRVGLAGESGWNCLESECWGSHRRVGGRAGACASDDGLDSVVCGVRVGLVGSPGAGKGGWRAGRKRELWGAREGAVRGECGRGSVCLGIQGRVAGPGGVWSDASPGRGVRGKSHAGEVS
jgi:hypothetical protein